MERGTRVEMRCPKDQAIMLSLERNGVIVDRCTECGGLFLDRGELERLVELEGQFNAQRGWVEADQERWRDDDEHYEHGRRGRRRRGGFLGEIFDFD